MVCGLAKGGHVSVRKKKTKDKDFQIGDIEIEQHIKVRVTTMLDEDALQGLKDAAEEKGVKYQTLLNKIVRSYVFAPQKSYDAQASVNEETVRRIVKEELKKSGNSGSAVSNSTRSKK